VVVCALVAHTAWHWMSDRWQAVDKFLQTVDGSQAVGLIMNSPIAWMLIALAAIWGLRRSLRQHADPYP
jgi:TRAP-type C4-dicarboxylate transport system permease small subunit